MARRQNTTVFMGEVTSKDKNLRWVYANTFGGIAVPLPYDYLILATRIQHSHFSRDEFGSFAPGLKTLADAEASWNKILGAFEQAETMGGSREAQRPNDSCFVVGAEPTAVELAENDRIS